MNESFQPARLRLAREHRAMNRIEVATALFVDPSVVLQWEDPQSVASAPPRTKVLALSLLLRFPVEWFYKPLEAGELDRPQNTFICENIGEYCVGCGGRPTRLCDHRTRGKKGTCDAPICDQCARRVGPNKDQCPLHTKVRGAK